MFCIMHFVRASFYGATNISVCSVLVTRFGAKLCQCFSKWSCRRFLEAKEPKLTFNKWYLCPSNGRCRSLCTPFWSLVKIWPAWYLHLSRDLDYSRRATGTCFIHYWKTCRYMWSKWTAFGSELKTIHLRTIFWVFVGQIITSISKCGVCGHLDVFLFLTAQDRQIWKDFTFCRGVGTITKLISALPWLKSCGCCARSQSEPVYFTPPVLSQAEHMAPVPDPHGLF